MRRFKNSRVPALHPVATHGFAAVVLLVQRSEAHDVTFEVRQRVEADDAAERCRAHEMEAHVLRAREKGAPTRFGQPTPGDKNARRER